MSISAAAVETEHGGSNGRFWLSVLKFGFQLQALLLGAHFSVYLN